MKKAFLYRYILELSTSEYSCLVGLNIKVGKKQMRGRLRYEQPLMTSIDDQSLSDKSLLIGCGDTYLIVPGSSNLNFVRGTSRLCVLKR